MSEQAPRNIIIKKKKQEEHPHHSTAWKIALADFMTTLMILFFILWVVTITPPDKKKALVSFFQGKYDPSSVISAQMKEDESGSMTGALYLSLSSEMSEFEQKVRINLSKGRIELNLESNVFFQSGKSEVTKDFKVILSKLVKVLKGKNVYLDIYGYTDSLPVKNNKVVKNNLNLSIMRAQSVADELIALGIPVKDIGVHGEGERFPVASNATAEGRAKNRRIVIFMSPKRGMARVDLFNQEERETVETFEKKKPEQQSTKKGKQPANANKK